MLAGFDLPDYGVGIRRREVAHPGVGVEVAVSALPDAERYVYIDSNGFHAAIIAGGYTNDMDIERVSERKIQEAIEAGALDNLPGMGKPLDLDDDPLTPPHLRLANRILKNANVLPDWVQVDVDVRR